MTKDNGGPAFPQGELDATAGYTRVTSAEHCGISMRDYFAAKALQGFAQSMTPQRFEDIYRDIQAGGIEAKVAFTLADAMLAERNK